MSVANRKVESHITSEYIDLAAAEDGDDDGDDVTCDVDDVVVAPELEFDLIDAIARRDTHETTS